MSMTVEERMETAEAYAHACSGRLRTMVQAGHDCLRDAARLARHAESLGVDAISATPPSYFRPRTVGEVLDCCEAVAAAAPDTPFFYYHIPALTGVEIDAAQLLRRARSRIPKFAGLKHSHPDLASAAACLRVPGDFEILYGCDESLLGALATGVHGAVGSTYNFAAPLYLKMIAAFARGDLEEARHCQDLAASMIDVILKTCGRSGMKAMMALCGLECGPSRLPLAGPAVGSVAELRHRLEALGFFSWFGPDKVEERPLEVEH